MFLFSALIPPCWNFAADHSVQRKTGPGVSPRAAGLGSHQGMRNRLYCTEVGQLTYALYSFVFVDSTQFKERLKGGRCCWYWFSLCCYQLQEGICRLLTWCLFSEWRWPRNCELVWKPTVLWEIVVLCYSYVDTKHDFLWICVWCPVEY